MRQPSLSCFRTLRSKSNAGDRRDDLCIVDKKTGAVTAWLNTGFDLVPDYHKIGVVAQGSTATEDDIVVLGDLTGNGRSDYMIIGDKGQVKGLVSRRQEMTLVPRWLPAFAFAAGPDGAEQDSVRLVDLTGDGKVDYLLLDEDGGITLWENTGKGGKY